MQRRFGFGKVLKFVGGGVVAAALAVVALAAIFSGDDREMNFIVEEADQGASPLARTGRFYRGAVIASDPAIVREGGQYRMYYTDLRTDRNRTVIAMATSADGLSWTPGPGQGPPAGTVLSGSDGRQDENLESAAVARDGAGGWLLWFAGYRDKGTPAKGFPAALFLARSSDGVRFERAGDTPVLAPTRGWYDNDAVYSPTVLRTPEGYVAVYVGHAYTDMSRIGGKGGVYLLAAHSPDGVRWTKRDTPIAGPGRLSGWMRDGVAEPYLVAAPDGTYLLFFTGLDDQRRAIGVATAPSPLGPWSFRQAPLLTPGREGAPDEHQVLAPAVLIENGRIRIWYLAADKRGRIAVGLVEGKWPEAIR